MPDRDPLSQWTGAFGAEYIKRNALDDATRDEAEAVFARILDQSKTRGQIESILEVGANIGINLAAIQPLLPAARLSALEPNPAACGVLRSSGSLRLERVLESTAYQIPARDGEFDLVFTRGVLIHLPPERLAEALREIVRVSRRFVLCAEYFSHVPEEVLYRDNSSMLWKRDFGLELLRMFPDFAVRGYGFLWQVEFPRWDDLNWWMLEKKSG
jgi:pseudaminic acid biosynthesis-associated methylase